MTSVLKVDTIQNSSGTAYPFVNPVRFSVRKTTAQTGLTDDSRNEITWETEVIDSHSAFASNRFTVPTGEGGVYMLYLTAGIGTGTDGTVRDAASFIERSTDSGSNFGGIAFGGARTGGEADIAWNICHCSVMVELDAGDIIRAMSFCNTDNNGNYEVASKIEDELTNYNHAEFDARWLSVFGGYRIA